MIKNPKDVAKLITHNLRVKFLNTNFVNKKLQLKLPTLFFEQPYIIGYICNFARWSNIAYCTLIKKKQIVDKQQQLNFNAEVYKFLNLPNDTIKTYLKLDDDKSFFNKFLDDKKNVLWILGLKQSRVLVYAYFDFKSKRLSKYEIELYEEAKEQTKNSSITNVIPFSKLETNFSTVILKNTLWKYLDELILFKKKEDFLHLYKSV